MGVNHNLPNEWAAREYQQPMLNYMLKGGLDRKLRRRTYGIGEAEKIQRV